MKKLKQTKKLGALTLALAMVLALLPSLNPPAQAAEPYFQPPNPNLTASVIPSNSGGKGPIRTILVFDVSKNMRLRTFMVDAAARFLDDLGEKDSSGRKHKLAIVAFAKSVRKGSFTPLDEEGKNSLKGELAALKAKVTGLGAQTNLGLGLDTALELIEESGTKKRCNIILFSDFKLNRGEQSASWVDFSKPAVLARLPASKIPLPTDIYTKPSRAFKHLPLYRRANKVLEEVRKLTDSHNLYSIGCFYGFSEKYLAIYRDIYMKHWQNAGYADLTIKRDILSKPAVASAMVNTIYGGFTAARNALQLPSPSPSPSPPS